MRATLTTLVLTTMILGACQSDPDNRVSVNADGQTDVVIGMPLQGELRALSGGDIEPILTVNGNEIELTDSGEVWRASMVVELGTAPTVQIDWVERYSTGEDGAEVIDLLLARRTFFTGVIRENREYQINPDDYITSGTAFDADSDGISNLAERIGGSDPLNAGDPGDIQPLVYIRPIVGDVTPIIDGVYDPLWNDAQFRNFEGQNLLINQLMVDNNLPVDIAVAERFQWAAMHDEEYVYIMVFGPKASTDRLISNDSQRLYDDDTLDIFLDPNLSRGTSYDQVDDVQLMIPLLEFDRAGSGVAVENNSDSSTARMITGVNSIPISLEDGAVKFATCLCGGGETIWEVRLDLDFFGIEAGQVFGLELQINEDVDGGLRDYKWGWVHPQKQSTSGDIDYTWQQPLYMGTALLSLQSPPAVGQ